MIDSWQTAKDLCVDWRHRSCRTFAAENPPSITR
jgi:hypothetical protein